MGSISDDTAYIQSLVADLNSAVIGSSGLNASDKFAVLQTAIKLTTALEPPSEAIAQNRHIAVTASCTQIGVDLGLFEILAQSSKPKTAKELAKATGADAQLIVRVMRVLAAMDFVKEVGEKTYGSSPRTVLLARPFNAAAARHVTNVNQLPTIKLPAFLKSNGYKNPTNSSSAPFQFGHDTNDPMFTWMEKRPKISADFNSFMQGVRLDRIKWWDFVPVQHEVLSGFKNEKDAVLMIDFGGGRGHDLMAFRKQFPQAPGRLILQDQQHVIESAVLSDGTEKMGHNFFTPQPIHGARLYFEHYILHDWDDEQCVQILSSVASAMTKGYSKLYLNEWILPDTGCSLYPALVDMTMMIALSGMERTRSQWQYLAGRAGLQTEKFWFPEGFGEGIIEMSKE